MGLDRGAVLRRDGGGDFQRFGRGVVPVGGFLRGIVGFAVIDIRHADRAILGDLPAAVGADNLHAAVLVLNAELGQQGLTVSRHAVLAGKDEAAHGPAACHSGGQGVMAGHKRRDIVGLIL